MAKKGLTFACSNCGATTSAWSGKCRSCGEWNTLIEQSSGAALNQTGKILDVSRLQDSLGKAEDRFVSNISEVDEVLGGGIVAGSINLIAGQPGIGKSTLLLQLAEALGKDYEVLYVSGEESLGQLALRAKRLGVKADKLKLAASVSADDIAATLRQKSYNIVIVDSIQTVSTTLVPSASGSVAQITNSTHLITEAAKATGTAVILVGHVTKEGSIAGPKVLEHLVDVVLQLEGDRIGSFKLLRAVKNRYGSVNETGIFEMTDKGLMAVKSPSAALLRERQVSDGSIVHATLEGSKAVLVEIQALVNTSVYGYPKRTSSGFDLNRLNLLLAMLEKRTKLRLSDKDIYVNVVGGLQLKDPSADLAIIMAVASASTGRQLKSDLVVFGEVGLSGEIRHVQEAEKRYREAIKIGFSGVIGPSIAKKMTGYYGQTSVRKVLIDYLEKD